MNALTGTRELAAFIGRRDRLRLPVWIYVLIASVLGTAQSFRSLYPTVAGREKLGASVVSNPTLRAVTGAIFNTSTLGGLVAWRVMILGGLVAALMSILTVVRHTRAEEEAGRIELIGAGVVGRFAPLTAVLLVVTVANLAAGLVCAAGLMVFGTGVAGSFALGLAIAADGIAFAAIAAIAVQVPESSRTANGIACTVLGIAFVARAAGDSGSGGQTWASWLLPLGWGERVRPYANERWWVFGLYAGLIAVCLVAAYALVTRRDIGAGLLPARLGPARAPAAMRSTFALAWRLHRPSLLGWSVGLLAFGAFVGGAANGIGSLVSSSRQMQDIVAKMGGPGGLTDEYLSTTFGLAGLLAAAYGVQAALRLRAEESAGRLEPVLATSARRWRWMGSHLVIAIVGVGFLLLMSGVGAGLAYGISAHDVGGQIPRLIEAALVQWPAAAIVAGAAAALFGLLPRATSSAWALLAVFALIFELGSLLRLGRVMDVSPFTHVPKLPGGTVAATPVIILCAVVVMLVTLGVAGFRRRDVS